jgi:hypothetical protein
VLRIAAIFSGSIFFLVSLQAKSLAERVCVCGAPNSRQGRTQRNAERERERDTGRHTYRDRALPCCAPSALVPDSWVHHLRANDVASPLRSGNRGERRLLPPPSCPFPQQDGPARQRLEGHASSPSSAICPLLRLLQSPLSSPSTPAACTVPTTPSLRSNRLLLA